MTYLLTTAAIAILLGTILGIRFHVLILLPVMISIFIVWLPAAVLGDQWFSFFAFVVSIVGVEVGYLVGVFVRGLRSAMVIKREHAL